MKKKGKTYSVTQIYLVVFKRVYFNRTGGKTQNMEVTSRTHWPLPSVVGRSGSCWTSQTTGGPAVGNAGRSRELATKVSDQFLLQCLHVGRSCWDFRTVGSSLLDHSGSELKQQNNSPKKDRTQLLHDGVMWNQPTWPGAHCSQIRENWGAPGWERLVFIEHFSSLVTSQSSSHFSPYSHTDGRAARRVKISRMYTTTKSLDYLLAGWLLVNKAAGSL